MTILRNNFVLFGKFFQCRNPQCSSDNADNEPIHCTTYQEASDLGWLLFGTIGSSEPSEGLCPTCYFAEFPRAKELCNVVQIRNPRSGQYVKINRSKGKIVEKSDKEFENIPVVGATNELLDIENAENDEIIAISEGESPERKRRTDKIGPCSKCGSEDFKILFQSASQKEMNYEVHCKKCGHCEKCKAAAPSHTKLEAPIFALSDEELLAELIRRNPLNDSPLKVFREQKLTERSLTEPEQIWESSLTSNNGIPISIYLRKSAIDELNKTTQ